MNFDRSIPPAAAPITFRDLLHGLAGLFRGERRLKQLEQQLQEFFGVKHVFLMSSGKAALFLILASLKTLSKRKQVLIPAYTCFSVPSAIVKAGLTVSCCDMDSQTLDFNYEHLKDNLTDDTLCVVPTHLLGLPSDVERVKDLCEGKGTFVVEDAAQAMGIKYGNRLAGTSGDVSFFSLGRGKNITCGSGGVILTNSDSIAHFIQKEYQQLTPEPLLGSLRNFCVVLAMRLLIDPRVYWLPSGLPFLGLGATKFYRDFPVHRMDGVRASLLSSWKERLFESNTSHSNATKEYLDRLPPSCQVVAGPTRMKVVLNRLPVIMRNKRAKADLCAASKANGLGISALYPSAIPDIAELKGSFASGQFQVATLIANCLVTLPVHQLVKPYDVERICRLLRQLQDTMDGAKMSPSRQRLGKEPPRSKSEKSIVFEQTKYRSSMAGFPRGPLPFVGGNPSSWGATPTMSELPSRPKVSKFSPIVYGYIRNMIKPLASKILYQTNLYRFLLTDTAIVVAFHRVSNAADDSLTCNVEVFKRYCEFFARYFQVVPLSNLIRKLEEGAPLDRELAITFDDGYQDNYLNAAPILKSMGFPATFFVATTFVGTNFVPWWDKMQSLCHPWMTWDQVQSLYQQGFEIGAHTRSHVDLSEVFEDKAWEEINGSRLDLEAKLSAPVELFAYPYGRKHQISTANRDLVKAAGFRCCCSCYGEVNARAADPFFLRRIPISGWYRSPYDLGFDLAFHRTEISSLQ